VCVPYLSNKISIRWNKRYCIWSRDIYWSDILDISHIKQKNNTTYISAKQQVIQNLHLISTQSFTIKDFQSLVAIKAKLFESGEYVGKKTPVYLSISTQSFTIKDFQSLVALKAKLFESGEYSRLSTLSYLSISTQSFTISCFQSFSALKAKLLKSGEYLTSRKSLEGPYISTQSFTIKDFQSLVALKAKLFESGE
jgi:hypothetical protein